MINHIALTHLQGIPIFEFCGQSEKDFSYFKISLICNIGYGDGEDNMENNNYDFGDGDDYGYGDFKGNGDSFNNSLILEETNA
jgi:hypothetical protein